jgi:hypothetical protein
VDRIGGAAWTWRDRMTATIRYYYSHTDFDTSGDDAGKDPITVQLAHRATAPLSLYAGYARGYESFETVTAGRLQQRGADTVSAGFSWRLTVMSSCCGAVEHRRRDASHVTIAVTRGF